METEILASFVYPNEHVVWSVMIVLYPYITGLVAGAFIISSLYHVFHVKALEPVAKFSLVAALAFLSFATAPLMLHLGHPDRAFNMMFTPNVTSAMAGFGFIYSAYFLLVGVECWLVFRPFLVARANEPSILQPLYKLLCLGVTEIPEEAAQMDHKIASVLAAVGIPAACTLHGYVGFIFGSIKANPWWSSALTPLIFLLSAMVSGMAAIVIGYWLFTKIRRQPIDEECLKSLTAYVWGFLVLDVTLEMLEVLSLAYESTEDWPILTQMMTQRIGYSFLGVQFLIGSVIPLTALGWVVLTKKGGRTLEFVSYVCSFLLLLQVLAMRWNVVVGGQSFSKSFMGLLVYEPEILGKEGLLMASIVVMAPVVLLGLLASWLPVWPAPRVRRVASSVES